MAARVMVAALAAASWARSDAQGACTTWYEQTQHGPGFRNVQSYGAKGDGVTDDSAAIIAALTQGRPTGFSTTDPTVVYFPAGTYLVTKTLPLIFYTFMTGNFRCPPTIKVAANSGFNGYVIDTDTDNEGGEHTDEFYRGLSFINIEIGAGNAGATGVHWAESQASYIRNVTIDAGDGVGIFGENGSGGWISDLTVTGGRVGLNFGNQQWTFRNVVVSGATAQCFNLFWNWAFALIGVSVSNCPVGIAFHGGAAGSLTLLDSTCTNVGTCIATDYPTQPVELLLDRFTAVNVANITNGVGGNPSGSMFIAAWRQGTTFLAGVEQPPGQAMLPVTRPNTPLLQRPKPVFGSPDGSTGVYNVYSAGAKGDGVTDDTAAVQAAVTANAQVFFPQGTYLLSAPITLRSDSVLIGEALSNLMASAASSAWTDASNPAPLLAMPANASASVQFADIIFTSNGDVPGCSFLEWQSGSGSGLWDVHWRAMHTAWGLMHISGPTAGGYIENTWGWVADHDIDTGANLTVQNPRGFTIEHTSQPLYMYGTAAEHSYLYQYNFTDVQNVMVVLLQTETPYWQNPQSAWAVTADNAQMSLYGAGTYSWFYPNQTALISVTNSPAIQLYDINTYGCETIIVGQDFVPINDTGVREWFCNGFIADTR